MARGYIVATLNIPDLAAYQASGYLAMAEKAVAAHGGTFLIRGGDPETLEGDPPNHRIVILEFPTREHAKLFYDSSDYAPAIEVRQRLSFGSLVLLSGFQQD